MNIEADAYVACRIASIKSRLIAYWRRMLASDFVRKVAETFATRVLLIGIGLITSVIVARILGPQGRGLYAVAAAIGAIGVQFGNLGLHASNTYYVAKDRSLLPALVGNTLVVSFAFGGGGAFAAWILFSLWPDLAPVNGFLLIIALTWVPFGLAYMLMQNLLLGLREVRAYNVVELTTKILSVCLIALVIAINMVSVETVFAVGFVSILISLLWVLWCFKPHLHTFPLPSFPLFKDNICYGAKAYLAAFFAFLVLRVDLLMIKYMLGAEQAGYYSIAVMMGNLLFTLPTIVKTILFPKLIGSRDMDKRWSLTCKTAYSVGAIMLLVCLGMLFFGRYIIVTLYGSAFEPAYMSFVIMSFGILIWSVESIFRSFLNSDPAKGFRIEVVYIWCGVLPVNIGLNYCLIPSLGINGAAIASAVSLLCVACYIAILVFKESKMRVVRKATYV